MRLSIPEGVIFETLDGETVILNVRDGSYFALNSSATSVWRWIEEHGDHERVTALLAETYGLEPDAARRDIDRLLDELTQLGLVVVDED